MNESKNLCAVCGMEIGPDNWKIICREYDEMFEQVDYHGEMSLTEHEQVIYHNKVHFECIFKLN